MSALTGTVVIDKLVPTDSADTYGTHEDKYGIGGLHTDVADITERDAIPTERRKEGMIAYVKLPAPTNYQLVGGITNLDWVPFSGGSAAINDASTSLTEVWSASKVNSLLPSLKSRYLVNNSIPASTNLNMIVTPPSLTLSEDTPVLGNNIGDFNRKALRVLRNGIELVKGTEVIYVNASTINFSFELKAGESVQIDS